ncbi:MAG: bifunctional phosphoribosyl-AMP cyclohydrolase/phosphoribosyl-ATP diphosphatase HisIE [Christensenellaceae bacterium]|jgi:histidine biosynthesis bifunctional protein hisIE|nr:bifunctional phosphoribosyl-AMP cyclohydrolase/phosphoribosyl-ATP diphosphatase HisIE [Christensenellaceae bacterium]MBS6564753.1 bifunctional phosphoribosyl-AMP cyclohydrolase/phosphoribosyl-ATP diphosphatase HisIE [Clostridiales bacterium]PWL96013.1 MAG: bifunctional phosphoribosyl-AMP cyclohydrolase/phosphoribosyl-ATP diphosphatase [Selenomonadales bacterium]
MDLSNIKFDNSGLVPVIAQDALTSRVLMLAYANAEALELSAKSGWAHYFSRSRNELWKKGETSGNLQSIVSISYDCDGDAVLYKVIPQGPACHTGETSCFFNSLAQLKEAAGADELIKEYEIIKERQAQPQEGSYTCYLLNKGMDKIAKKVGEEAVEVVIAGKNGDREEICYETADLLYHLMVLLAQQDISLYDICAEMKKRR